MGTEHSSCHCDPVGSGSIVQLAERGDPRPKAKELEGNLLKGQATGFRSGWQSLNEFKYLSLADTEQTRAGYSHHGLKRKDICYHLWHQKEDRQFMPGWLFLC